MYHLIKNIAVLSVLLFGPWLVCTDALAAKPIRPPTLSTTNPPPPPPVLRPQGVPGPIAGASLPALIVIGGIGWTLWRRKNASPA